MSHDKDDAPMSMSMNNGTMDTMVMHMTFFWSKEVVMLFNGWPNGELKMYISALAFVLFLAVFVEFLSIFPVVKPGSSPIVGGLIHASFYGLRMALVYLLMLCVMSYNVGIFVFVVIGHIIGFFVVKYRVISKSRTDPV
ncbi:ctr copper transporter [Artemisia annua]|uniref:Copper transport protein n=1 Tax=Artemisia annua TaxID=35608 RepID=A0A2U1Q137_ARTAN|nr:ctr copper transporter [Artemisia annua]